MSFDPTAIWYRSELAFFDYYVIPLARKMSDSGVFGPSGDQYLTYATNNRNEWEKKGLDALRTMIEAAKVETESSGDFLASSSHSRRSYTTSEGTQSDVDSCAPLPEAGEAATARARPRAIKSSGRDDGGGAAPPPIQVIPTGTKIKKTLSSTSADNRPVLPNRPASVCDNNSGHVSRRLGL